MPHALILHMADLGISASQFVVVSYLLACKWDHTNPFPSAKLIAEGTGLAYNTVRTAIEDLDAEGLVKRIPRPRAPDGNKRFEFDLSGLLERLTNIHRARIAPRLRKAGPADPPNEAAP